MEGDYFLLRQQNKHGLHGGGNNSSKVRWVVLGPRGWFLVPGGGSWTPGWFLDPGMVLGPWGWFLDPGVVLGPRGGSWTPGWFLDPGVVLGPRGWFLVPGPLDSHLSEEATLFLLFTCSPSANCAQLRQNTEEALGNRGIGGRFPTLVHQCRVHSALEHPSHYHKFITCDPQNRGFSCQTC